MADRTSPPTERVVAVLDFLARHPHDRFGLSELARRLGLSKPTCLGILTTLTESDYLIRDGADKAYRLGPKLISLGHTAQESMRVNPAAREELRRLSARPTTPPPRCPPSSTTASPCWNSSGRQVRTSESASARAIRSHRPSG